jgi:hypothetical protein
MVPETENPFQLLPVLWSCQRQILFILKFFIIIAFDATGSFLEGYFSTCDAPD